MESDMSNEVNFRKVGNTWMVVSTEPLTAGATVPVELRSGDTKPVKLGRLVGYIYAVDKSGEPQDQRRSRWQYRDADERDDYRN
jgi:hypothetical protein